MQPRFLIDTDTASDDAVALIMALRAVGNRLVAITTVAGNVPVMQATQNALYTIELCGLNVPVYQGFSKPMFHELVDATWFHGKDGLGERRYPPAQRQREPKHAVDAIIHTIQANPGVVLVTLGPLTNIAMAILREPDIVTNVSRCIVMGGNPCCEGNVTPAAEYNIWVDPEAARIVLRSALPIELVGWQLSRGDAVLNASDIQKLLGLDTKLARFAIECNSIAMEAYRRQTKEIGISLPDPIAMSVALDETICTASSEHYLDVEVTSELTRGMTVVDRLGVASDERNREVWGPVLDRVKKARVCWSIDTVRWKQALYLALAK